MVTHDFQNAKSNGHHAALIKNSWPAAPHRLTSLSLYSIACLPGFSSSLNILSYSPFWVPRHTPKMLFSQFVSIFSRVLSMHWLAVKGKQKDLKEPAKFLPW